MDQATDSAKDYIYWFQELIDIMEYDDDDDKTIAIKFHKGLNLAIQNKVALTGDGAPDFNDPGDFGEDQEQDQKNIYS